MRSQFVALMLVVRASEASSLQAPAKTVSLKTGSVYCVSAAALTEHADATDRGDTARVRDILTKRRLCDYTQTATTVTITKDGDADRWLQVRPATDEEWHKGSKLSLPADRLIYVKRSAVK